MTGPKVDREMVAYTEKLLDLLDRFAAGERHGVGTEARAHADALICLLEVAPSEYRSGIDYIIDRYESLSAACAS